MVVESATRIVRAPGMQDDNLRIAAAARTVGGAQHQVMVLIDTGARVSLIRKGLIPFEASSPAVNPIRLLTAGKQALRGGEREVQVDLVFAGCDEDTGEPVQVVAPTALFEAEITDDVIVSYTWLGARGFDVSPRRHGLFGRVGDTRVWVRGQAATTADPPVASLQIRRTSTKPKRALDLFSGTGSATRVLQAHGFNVVSVDNDPRWEPTHCVNILEWDYAARYDPGTFDIVVAAPPCTEFSRALTTRPRCLDQAYQLVAKTLEIVDYFQPAVWWLETPAHGLLARS